MFYYGDYGDYGISGMVGHHVVYSYWTKHRETNSRMMPHFHQKTIFLSCVLIIYLCGIDGWRWSTAIVSINDTKFERCILIDWIMTEKWFLLTLSRPSEIEYLQASVMILIFMIIKHHLYLQGEGLMDYDTLGDALSIGLFVLCVGLDHFHEMNWFNCFMD